MVSRSSLWLFANAIAVSAAGCIPSNVVAVTDRAVVVEAEHATWRPATSADVPGLWSSSRLLGPVSTMLLEVVYLFEAEGHFTGAALFAGPPPEFKVLSGTWAFDAQGRFVLGDGADGAVLEAAEGMLRMSGEDGAVVLNRQELR
jgi:hypothetical protein